MAIDQTDIHHYADLSNGFYSIDFQEGTVSEAGENGCQNEDIIEVLVHRLQGLQDRLPCRENLDAIAYLNCALSRLERRTSKRVAQGVEGTTSPHT